MAEPIRPAATKTFGRSSWILVMALADITDPTVTEVTATTGLDITRIAFATTGRPTQSTNRVTAERRLGDTKQYESIGISNVTGGDLVYAFADQAASGADGKKLYEKIPAGTVCYLVERKGVNRATAPAAGQFVNVYPVEFGPSFPAEAGEAEASESAMTAAFAVIDEPAINVALSA